MRLLLADDHVLFRDTFIHFAEMLKPEWKITSCNDFDDAFDHLQNETTFDLVMLDFRMPGMNGLEGFKKIKATFPDQKTALLSGVVDENQVREAMALGTAAYLPKTLTGRSLIKAIDLVISGEKFVPLDNTGTRMLPSYFDGENDNLPGLDAKARQIRNRIFNDLSRREKQVLHYLGQGLSNKEIAKKLDLQVATVKLHVSGICKKIGADNRTKAAILAYRYRLIDPDDTIMQKTS